MKANFTNRKSVVPFVLVGVGVGMGMLLSTLGDVRPAIAQSRQDIDPKEILSAGAQRAKLIERMESVDRRLATIESKLNGPLSVKVLEMPAVKMVDSK